MSSEKLQWIEKAPLFESLSPDEQKAVSGLLRQERFCKGETLYHRGDPSEALYLIREGSVRLRDDRNMPIATLSSGSLLGEVEALLARPRAWA